MLCSLHVIQHSHLKKQDGKMHIDVIQHFERGWKVYVDDKASLLKIYNRSKHCYFVAFGPNPSPCGTPFVKVFPSSVAEEHSFSLRASDAPKTPDGCSLVAVSLQEGDTVDIETLELIEMQAGTYTVDAFVRGYDMTFFHILRNPNDLDEFKILALIAPKRR